MLNKDYSYFSGEVKWNDKNISVSMEVDKNDRCTWEQVFENLRFLFNNMQQKDQEFRRYAAEQLTELANDWLQDEEDEEITEDMFVSRINLVELAMDYNGDYSLYYNDDDMFWGHIIDIVGSIETGPTSASIAG